MNSILQWATLLSPVWVLLGVFLGGYTLPRKLARGNRVDEKVADALSAVYGPLRECYDELCNLPERVGSKERKEKVYDVFRERGVECETAMFSNRLYIPQPLWEKTRGAFLYMCDKAQDFHAYCKRADTEHERPEDRTLWSDTARELDEKISPLFKEITAEFQKRMGVVE